MTTNRVSEMNGGVDLERTFPFHKFSGTHLQIGQQYGESCSALIKQNFDYSYQRLLSHTGVTHQQVQDHVLQYRPFVIKYAPFLDEEIQGLSEGSGLSLTDAYFLQLRAELEVLFSPKSSRSAGMECTTFFAHAGATLDGKPLGGQNADLPGFYAEISIVMEIVSEDLPSILMVTPAGQVSYIGINRSGLCAFANYMSCGGWRTGYPRYFLSRLALTQNNVHDAEVLLTPIIRASSRNLLLLDASGQAVDLEFAVERRGKIDIRQEIFVHSNHFIAPELYDEELASPKDLHNSRVRLDRLQALLEHNYGRLDAALMQQLLRDRETHPDTLSIEPGDDLDSDYITVTSVIAEPAHSRIWVTAGPPSLKSYQQYSFSLT
jgi:predicted choloylglycine hydrolase